MEYTLLSDINLASRKIVLTGATAELFTQLAARLSPIYRDCTAVAKELGSMGLTTDVSVAADGGRAYH